MITPQSASIIWAVLATGGGIGIWVAMRGAVNAARRECAEMDRRRKGWRDKAWGYHREANTAKLAKTYAEESLKRHMAIFVDASDRLRAIEQQRHASAKHARQAQLSQQRAKVLAKASELVRRQNEERRAA